MITSMPELIHPQLPGVKVWPFGTETKAGTAQEVLVWLPPNATIPLHKHTVDAEMFIVEGDGALRNAPRVLHHDDIARHQVGRGKAHRGNCRCWGISRYCLSPVVDAFPRGARACRLASCRRWPCCC